MFHGADTGQLQNVAQRLGESSGRTSELLRRGDHRSAVRGLGGPDADRFRQELFGSVTNGWRQLIERLHLSEDEMRAHADEQDQASDARDRRSPGANGGGDADPAAQEDRHARDAADAPVTAKADRGDGTDPQPTDTDGAIDGPKPYSGNGLGPGVPGTSADTPEPPAWRPADSGSGEWNSREPTDEDRENLGLAKDMVLGGRFTGKGAERSFGPGGGPGRAWVTYENVRDVFGIDAVPTTWRLSRSKPAGLELERYLLIDDGDPATVWVATCPALDAVSGNGWSA